MKAKRKWGLLLLAVVVSMTVAACSTKESGSTQKETETKEDQEALFGDFEAKTLLGETVNQDIFTEKKLTMVNIWATFCQPCIQEMPDLRDLNKEYADKGFQIVGMISDTNEIKDEAAMSIVEATGADYVHILPDGELAKVMQQVQAVPTTVFLNEEGKIVGQAYAGARSKEAWTEIIEEKLDEVGV